jgi:hypothetical protein
MNSFTILDKLHSFSPRWKEVSLMLRPYCSMAIWTNSPRLRDGEKDFTPTSQKSSMGNFTVNQRIIISQARGGADDHYSIFGSVLAVKAC